MQLNGPYWCSPPWWNQAAPLWCGQWQMTSWRRTCLTYFDMSMMAHDNHTITTNSTLSQPVASPGALGHVLEKPPMDDENMGVIRCYHAIMVVHVCAHNAHPACSSSGFWYAANSNPRQQTALFQPFTMNIC